MKKSNPRKKRLRSNVTEAAITDCFCAHRVRTRKQIPVKRFWSGGRTCVRPLLDVPFR